MTDPEDKKLISLEESFTEENNAPPDGAQADIARLQKLGERTLTNRTRLLDRFNQMPLYGKSREKALTGKKERWRVDGVASDHPLVQMILSLRLDEDELMEKDGDTFVMDMEAKERLRLKLSIKTKIADLLISLQKENDQVFKELQTYIEHENHKKEHKEKLAASERKGLADLSDAELLKLAKEVEVDNG